MSFGGLSGASAGAQKTSWLSGLVRSVRRFVRLYAAVVRFSVARSLEFRFDFFFRFFMDCLYYLVSIGFFKLLFMHTPALGGWRYDQVLVFLAGGMLLDGFYMAMIAPNIWDFPRVVNKGELDSFLTRPAHPLLTLLLRTFECSSLLNVFVGAGVLTYALASYTEPFGAVELLGFLFLLANGFVLVACIRLFAVLPVFWTHSQFGFHMLFHALDQVLERPEVIFRGMMHAVFLTIIPFFVVTSFPARWFFGALSIWELSYALLLTLCFVLLVGIVWNRGVRAYSSASS